MPSGSPTLRRYQPSAAELAKTNMDTPFGKLTFSKSNKIKYQGFKAGEWLNFQYKNGKRSPVYPIEFARTTIVYPLPDWNKR